MDGIEFHGVDSLPLTEFFKIITVCFEKLFRDFSICHVHPNNCCGVENFDGLEIPRIFEVTFIRNDLVEELRIADSISLPHELDRKNVSHHDDIEMPKIWWEEDNG